MLVEKFIEIIGLLLGIWYIFLIIRENILAWPIGILAVLFYAYSCFQIKLFGEMSLQFLYVIVAVYGYVSWKRNENTSFSVTRLNLRFGLLYLVLAVFLSAIFYKLLQYLNGSLQGLDAITNGFAVVATYLAVRKKIENWLIWIPVNLLTIFIVWIKGMPFYALLYLGYTVFAIYGFVVWRERMLELKREFNNEIND